jgi:hypothetical protein
MKLQTDFFLAYIDPGTGSLVLQMIIASVLGVAAFFRNSIARFFRLILRRKPSAAPDVLPRQSAEAPDLK